MVQIDIYFSENLKVLCENLKEYPAVFVVADRKVRRDIADPLVEFCAMEGVAIRGLLCIRAGEKRKTLTGVEKIIKWLAGAGADTDALLLAVGGGTTTDIASFAACIYKRGIRYANVPTTLLAQVDAGIGGKTGCNVAGLKNLAGTICQPQFTFINFDYIRSLPWNELMCGYAEMLKTFIIADPVAYRDAVALEDFSRIGPLIRSAAMIKRDIVLKDENDKGQRRLLNLGHTYAHAIETLSGRKWWRHRIPHGYAVAMGIILAARRAELLKYASKGLARRLEEDFMAVGLPVECPFSQEEMDSIIRNDKKVAEGKVHYVLPRAIGDVIID